jgi:hypothetical protein
MMPLLGNGACNFKKIPTLTQDLSMEMHRYKRGSVSTYPRRTLAEASHDAVDVVELSSGSTDRVPNVRHLRVLHTYSSVMFLAFLIQQDVEVVDEFRQHDGMATVMVK